MSKFPGPGIGLPASLLFMLAVVSCGPSRAVIDVGVTGLSGDVARLEILAQLDGRELVTMVKSPSR